MSKEVQEVRQMLSCYIYEFNEEHGDTNMLCDCVHTLLQDHERQSKVIELMAEYIEEFMVFDVSEHLKKICKKRTEEDCYADIYQENACINCIKEYFEKKASE